MRSVPKGLHYPIYKGGTLYLLELLTEHFNKSTANSQTADLWRPVGILPVSKKVTCKSRPVACNFFLLRVYKYLILSSIYFVQSSVSQQRVTDLVATKQPQLLKEKYEAEE